MKKFLFIIATLILCLSATAQDAYDNAPAKERFAIGFKVAPAVSWISPNSDNTSSDGSSLKFNWGFTVKYILTENFSLVSGFNVNGLGGDLKFVNNDVRFASENKFSAFEIPLSFRLTTEPFFEKYFFFAQVGLSANYVFNPRLKYSAIPAELTLNIDEDKSLNRFVFAYNLALGAEYQMTAKMALTTHILFNNSLTSLLRSNRYRVDGNRIGGTYNFVELGIGVMFY